MAIMTMALLFSSANARLIHFSGYDWKVKTGTGAPNPNSLMENYWSDSNQSVWVDEKGLHLKVWQDPTDNIWKSAEVMSVDPMSYGTYSWKINGRIDDLDPNIVVGLFLYSGNHDHEYDVEFSRWGNDSAKANNADYACWGPNQFIRYGFHMDLTGDYTTHLINWQSDRVSFQSDHGHRNTTLPSGIVLDSNYDEALPIQNPTITRIASWYPNNAPRADPAKDDMHIHMNLWLDNERHPQGAQNEVEIIISEVKKL